MCQWKECFGGTYKAKPNESTGDGVQLSVVFSTL